MNSTEFEARKAAKDEFNCKGEVFEAIILFLFASGISCVNKSKRVHDCVVTYQIKKVWPQVSNWPFELKEKN